jgi:hypothetical protein
MVVFGLPLFRRNERRGGGMPWSRRMSISRCGPESPKCARRAPPKSFGRAGAMEEHVAQGLLSSHAAFPPRRGFYGALEVVTISFDARLEKPRLPKVRCGKGPRRWKSHRAEPRALRYFCCRGWRRDCPSCRRLLTGQIAPRIGRGDRDVARLRGAPRCIGRQPKQFA